VGCPLAASWQKRSKSERIRSMAVVALSSSPSARDTMAASTTCVTPRTALFNCTRTLTTTQKRVLSLWHGGRTTALLLLVVVALSSAKKRADATDDSTRIHVTDVHARDPKGFTTLHLAADKGSRMHTIDNRHLHSMHPWRGHGWRAAVARS
jgi:hypothetical protein